MDINVELRPKSGELRPQHNTPGEYTTRENVLEFDPDDSTLVNIRIETVQYGLYEGKAAALIVLQFIIQYRQGFKRIRSFNVNVEFSNSPKSDTSVPTSFPRVADLAPKQGTGRIFTEEGKNNINLQLEAPIDPLGQKIKVTDEIVRNINKEYELNLNGWKKSSKAATDNVVVWDCVEAKKIAKGVVQGYPGAIIVLYPEAVQFQAKFKLDADRGVFNFETKVYDWLAVFGKKDEDDPVIFNPSEPKGKQYNLADFKDLNLEQFIRSKSIVSPSFISNLMSSGSGRNDPPITAQKNLSQSIGGVVEKDGRG